MTQIFRSTASICMVLLLACAACGGKKQPAPANGPPLVEAVRVLQRDVPEIVEYVGQTEAPTSVEIRARVEGFIQEVAFKEGSTVKEGDLLFVIDPKPFQEQLANAQAKLAEAQANQMKAQQDVDRFAPLAKIQAIPKRDFDTAVMVNEQAKALVAAAQAQVKGAELDLGYTQISAPTPGRIGASLVRVGSLVGKGDPTLLATISTIDKIWATFNVPEVNYLRFSRENLATGRKPEDLTFQLILADGEVWPSPGKVSFADRTVDPTTGTLKVRVEFANPNGILRPGLYARVRIKLREIPGALLIPQKAVQQVQDRDSVYVVGDDNKVMSRAVALGSKLGNFTIVQQGLQAGDRVVVEGLQILRDGMSVQVKEIPVDASQILETLATPDPSRL